MSQKATLAEQADRHTLYQDSVQCVESEIDFVDETFIALRGRKPHHLREDFCGTANTACEWVRRRKSNYAYAVDIDPEVLAWGRAHNLKKLQGNGKKRIKLLKDDVLKVKTPPLDCVLAMNFSYWLFTERDTMRRYFKRIRKNLVHDGILFLDAYGGYDAPKVLREQTHHEEQGFTYVWHQATYNPIDATMTCYIDFKFTDGSMLKRAFSYHWRLWSLPELREILMEAGFTKNTIYLQGSDPDTGEGNGVFLPTERGSPDAGWICYIVAEK